ncbi:MAG: agmatinase [Albidovulum sp.]|nr:agmatinase [Albidovulum sp.]
MSNDNSPTPFDPMAAPRYSELATFFRAPLAQSAKGIDIAVIGVPYDGSVTNRPGARHGPREIRNMSSMMRSIHHSTRRNPYEICTVADLGDVRFSEVFNVGTVITEIESFYSEIVRCGAVPLTAGGDHSITYPIFKALAVDGPIGMIQIDAHTDTWDSFQGSKFSHGAPFRRSVEDGLLDPEKTIQIGIRGAQNTTEGWDYSIDSGMRVVFMDELCEAGVDKIIGEARRIVGDGPTYISFDIDGLDPAFAPGTGTPEIGGISTLDALKLIRGLNGLNLVGADVVEVSPPFDPTGVTALTGATFMYEILCLLAEAVARGR